MRIGAFEMDCVFRPSFVLAEVCSGRAWLLRALRIRNVRGTAEDWLKLCVEINGRRGKQKAVRNLPVGDEAAAEKMEAGIREALTVPVHTGPGVYSARLLVSDENGETEWPFTFRVQPPQVIPTDFARAALISASVRADDALRAFAADAVQGSADPLRALYRALLEKDLIYHPVAVTHEIDCQETAKMGYVLEKGGSCADLSLLFASLLHCWGVPPALLLFRDHMAAGCFDPDRLPAFETLEGSDAALALMAEGMLKAVECTAVCRPEKADVEEAEQKLIRRLESGEPCVIVNVCQALRGGVAPLPDALPPYIRCPYCGYDRFAGSVGGAMSCPCCGRSFAPVLPKAEEEPPAAAIPFSANLRFSVIQGGAAVIKALPTQEETVRIPPVWQGKAVRRIGDRALEGCGAARVILPDSVTRIGDYAFHACRNLQKLALPPDLNEIGTGAFSGSGLREIALPTGVRRIPRMAFAQCEGLEKAILPEGLQLIDERAFAGCPSLRAVQIPASVRHVAANAFDPACELLLTSEGTQIL